MNNGQFNKLDVAKKYFEVFINKITNCDFNVDVVYQLLTTVGRYVYISANYLIYLLQK